MALKLIQGKQINVNLTGSFSGSFTGNLIGSASFSTSSSFANNSTSASYSISSSYAVSSSFANNSTSASYSVSASFTTSASFSSTSISSSFASTASYVNPLNQNVSITGSLSQGSGNTATGTHSHAEGQVTQAIGVGSHAEGSVTTAQGNWSHAEGASTQAIGAYSHGEGNTSIAIGDYSHAEGENTETGIQTAFHTLRSGGVVGGLVTLETYHGDMTGRFTPGGYLYLYDAEFDGTYGYTVFIIDTVTWNGSNTLIQLVDTSVTTNEAYVGDLTYLLNNQEFGGDTTIPGQSSHAEGISTRAVGPKSHAEGSTTFALGNTSHAEGYSTEAIGVGSHAEGATNQAVGSYSHAEGEDTVAKGYGSHAEGGGTTTVGSYSHAEGNGTTSSGSYSHAEGEVTLAKGYGSHAEGKATQATGQYSHAEGESAIASGSYSHAEGTSTQAIGNYSHAEGASTQATGEVSHAEGVVTQAIGYGSHAEGFYTVASGSYQHVQGQYNLSSSAQSAFIIGNGTADNARRNLVFASGSTFQITGSLTVSGSSTLTNIGPAIFSGSVVATQGFSGSFSGSGANLNSIPSSAITGLNLAQIATGSVTASVSLSQFTVTSGSSTELTVTGTGVTIGSTITDTHRVTGSLNISGSVTATNYTGSLFGTSSWASNATTASYVLNAVSSSFASTASLAPAYLPLAGGTVSGSLTITSNLTVLGSASIQYVSESTLNIGTNLITVNTFNPTARFGGLAIIDSGSSPQVSASFLYDSLQDEFIFVHRGTSTSAITSSHFVLGPETYNDLGNETYLTANRIPKGVGNEHLNDSNISDNGSVVSINSNSEITGSLRVTQGITGSLFGTSSWAISAISSSYPVAASSSMIYTTVPSAGSTGKNNTILLGANAGGGTTSIYNSNFIGISAGQSATNAYQSNFIGAYAGAEATRADNANFIGLFAGYKAVSASFSTLIGWQAGQTNDPLLSIGSNNIIIGTNITLPSNTRDSINLGGIIFATGSYSNVGGFTYSGSQSGIGRVGINKVVPEYTLDVSGSGNYSNGLTVTGSLIATSSWATNTVTASYVLNAVSSSFASTASFAPNYVLTSVTSSMLQPYVLSSNTSSFVTNSQTSSMSVATASYVQNAQSASYVLQAVSSSFATSASYAANGGVTQIIAGTNITITPTNGLGAVTIASTGGGGSGAGANVTSSFTNSSTWTFIHALGNQGVVVQTYDTSWNQIIPQNITLTDSNTATITFPSAQSGYAIATLGGTVSTAATASYVLNAVSSSFATTASFVNILNQNVIITGSLAIGTGSIGGGESNLVLGPSPAGGTGEGGQIGLLGTGGSYTSSSFIDTYQNQIRIIAGQGTASTTGILAIDLGTKNAVFQGAVTASGFNGLPNDYLYATRNGSNQTVGSAWANTDIIFNNVSVSKGISFNTSTGVASLTGGKVYRVTARLAWSAAAAYNLQFSCYTSANVKIGPDVEIVQSSNGTSNISDGTLEFIYAPAANTDIKIRCTGNNTALSGEQIRADLNTQFIIQQIA